LLAFAREDGRFAAARSGRRRRAKRAALDGREEILTIINRPWLAV
jgi:hypothetical protein